MRNLAASILAVITGFITMGILVIVLTLAAVKRTHVTSGHPSSSYLFLNVLLSLAAALAGGFVTAALAKRWRAGRPAAHGLALAAVMVVANALALVHPAPGQPIWYLLFLLVVPPAFAIFGAKLVKADAGVLAA
jgi:hypothetical protein